MSAPNWDRLGATAGVVYIVLALTGFAIHGYPKQGASSEELRSWIAATDATRFSLGVYIEALGTVLFIPFAAWLSSLLSGPALHQRWLSNTVVGSAVAFVVLTLPINELYLGSLEAGKQGADVGAFATIRPIAVEWYVMTAILFALVFLAAGGLMLRGRALWRWLGWAACAVGVIALVPGRPTYLAAALLSMIWIVILAGWIWIRPMHPREALLFEVSS